MAVHNARPGMLLDPGNPINKGLVAWWPMWEGAGSKCMDISHKTNDGVSDRANNGGMTNGPVWAACGVKFDGVDDYISYPTDIKFINRDFTIAGKMIINGAAGGPSPEHIVFVQRTDVGGTGQPIVHLGTTGSAPYNLKAVIRDNVGVATVLTGATSMSAGRAYSVAVTKTSSAIKIYLDGKEEASSSHSLTGSFSAGVVHRFLGKTRYTAADQGFFNGSIHGLRVLLRALSEIEIRQLHLNPNAGLWVPDMARYYLAAAGGFQPAWAANSNIVLNGTMAL